MFDVSHVQGSGLVKLKKNETKLAERMSKLIPDIH